MHRLSLKSIVILFVVLTVDTPLSMVGTRAAETELSVKASVVAAKCLARNNDLAEVRLRFEFRNSSPRSLILKKSDLEVETIKYFANVDEQTGDAHLGELAIERLRGYLPENDQQINRPRPSDLFVILRSRRVYAFETTESIPLISASRANPSAKQSDEYQLEFELGTWVNHEEKLADLLRNRWTRFGILWMQTVWSNPVKFVFPRKRTCQA